MFLLVQTHCLTDRIVLIQAVDTDLLLRRRRNICVIHIFHQLRSIIENQKYLILQHRHAAKLHHGISQRIQASIRHLFDSRTADGMAVDSIAEGQINHVAFTGSRYHIVGVCTEGPGVIMGFHKILQHLIRLCLRSVCRVIQAEPLGAENHHIIVRKADIIRDPCDLKNLFRGSVFTVQFINLPANADAVKAAVFSKPELVQIIFPVVIGHRALFSVRVLIKILIGKLLLLIVYGRGVYRCNASVRSQSQIGNIVCGGKLRKLRCLLELPGLSLVLRTVKA